MKYTREDIERIVEEEDVEFIRLQFTDIFGKLKNVAITANNLGKALDGRFVFDGTYIDGYDANEETDMFLVPDYSTFEIFPWRPQSGKVARLICDVQTTDGTPAADDSRRVLRDVLQRIEEKGMSCNVGPECEFFLFQTDDMGRPTTESAEDAGYLDLGHSDLGENVRRDMVFALEDMDFDIESSYHEKAAGQHEIDFKYVRALEAADDIITFKLAVKNVAKQHGLLATFMPKPVNDVVGSGMHINFSIEKEGRNLFYDEKDPHHLSETAYHFMAGILDHLAGFSLVLNPIVNSYKRLAGTKYVPRVIGYASSGKDAAIRIPYFKRPEGARIELKCPDAACNPYLAISLVLAAGIDGIRRKAPYTQYDLQKSAEPAILPTDMKEAIDAFSKDSFAEKVLGTGIYEKYLEQKVLEWKEYIQHVSEWEIDRYLTRF